MNRCDYIIETPEFKKEVYWDNCKLVHYEPDLYDFESDTYRDEEYWDWEVY